ncbi:MAG TPA: extracellular solute-binding protein [Lachnospiraceae bacterium]|nr:extracellular solute-binding protein [Lachnospiraceae bacterium]
MKKTSNKVVALLITLAMSFSLVACGSAKETKADPATDKVVTDGESEVVDEVNEEVSVELSSYEAVDLGGRTIKIGLWWDEFWDSRYLTLDEVDAAGGAYSNAETMQMKLDAIRAVEEKWNCKIEWVNLGWDGIIESINTSVTAGTPECDLYLTDLQFGLAPVLNGYAQKISEIAPADSDILNDQIVLTRVDILGDDDYLFHESTTIPAGAMYMAYNAAMIDELGLEAPEALAAKGEWTWDKFAEYAKACTKDTDGDGNPDVYGYGTAWTLTVQGIVASNNGGIAVAMTEGLSSPSTVEAFEFINKLYNEDKSARPYTNDWNDDLLAFSSGKVAFTFTQPWILVQETANHDFDMRICPTPTGPSGDGSITPPAITNNYFIPVGVKDATSVYCVFEEMMNWFYYDTEWRDDPEWFESAFVDSDQAKLATELGLKAKADIWNNIDKEGAIGDVFYSVVVDATNTVAQAIESNKQVLQDELDALK